MALRRVSASRCGTARLIRRFYRKRRNHKQLSSEKAKLTTQRHKLVEAIYSGAMPLDLIASEQQRISSQLATVEERVNATTATFDEIEANLATALDLARDCHAAYLAAEPHLRRLFNQAFFTHLYIDDDGVRHDYAEPFDTLLGDDVLDAGRAIQADPGAGQITMADLLGGEDPRPAPTARPPGHFVPLGVLLLDLRHLFTVSKVRIGLVWCPWQDSNLRPSDQKAASGMSIRVLSVALMMARRAVSSGRMLRAKNPAAATLPW
jgi:uncharacterized membrane-anchored protein YhcB (DUF1043 family)